MGMRMVDPHPVGTQWRKGTEGKPFHEEDVHDPETACGKKQGKAAEQKGKCGMMEVLLEKIVEIERKTAEECHDPEEQDMTDEHHP